VNGILGSIEERIKSHVENMEIDVVATSRFYYEPSDVHAIYESHEFLAFTKDQIDLDVVRVTSEVVVVRLIAQVKCTVHASFSLTMTDPIDKDEINMGSQDADTEIRSKLKYWSLSRETFRKAERGGSQRSRVVDACRQWSSARLSWTTQR